MEIFLRPDEIPSDLLEFFEPVPDGEHPNTWLLSPEPFPAAHFATFPTEIPRRAILAGTSEWGCCASCGAPWRRVVEGRSVNAFDLANRDALAGRAAKDGVDKRRQRSINPDYVEADYGGEGKHTTGWQRTCTCTTTEVVPATVLDCFSGAGTTVLVANRLGRRGVGIELNPEYVRMARERIIGDAPLFNMPELEATA